MASRSIKNRPDIKKKHPMTGVLVVLTVTLACIVAGIGGIYAVGNAWLQDLPDYSNIASYNIAQKTHVYANDKQTLLAEFYVQNREPVPASQISPYVLKGTVATEDERFYEHDGVDPWGIARAIVVNLTGSSREGASTITQQFVRATILADEANEISLKRKVREAYLSMKLEESYTKDEILLMYLNTINYGQGAYGIEAASQTYYQKHASELSIAEAATLIGIPQSPTYNNPVDYPDTCLERRNLVLSRMLKNGVINQQEHDAAVQEPLNIHKLDTKGDGIQKYPYFTSYVRDQLVNKYSKSKVFEGGLTVYTTLDPSVQDAAERAAANKEAYMADDMEVALTAVDPNTGYIKAMVGGKDFYTDQYNLATQAKRSPGSSFKTFTLVTALEQGISPQTLINCSSTVTLGDWSPENYGGASYGTRSIASAFAVSSNTAFARLITALGPDKVAQTAKKMGIETDLKAVPSMTLGSEEVTTKEMAGAYATIANGGIHHNVEAVEKIIDQSGRTIYEADPQKDSARVLSPEIAHAAEQVMEGVLKGGGTGTEAALSTGQVAAGKTGTSENWRDSYFCGITPQMSVAVWLGSRQERQMPESLTATSVFSDFMDQVLSGQQPVPFPTADDPKYTPYSNPELDIGGYASGGGSTGNSGSYNNNYSYQAPAATDPGQGTQGDGQGGSDGTDTGGTGGTGDNTGGTGGDDGTQPNPPPTPSGSGDSGTTPPSGGTGGDGGGSGTGGGGVNTTPSGAGGGR